MNIKIPEIVGYIVVSAVFFGCVASEEQVAAGVHELPLKDDADGIEAVPPPNPPPSTDSKQLPPTTLAGPPWTEYELPRAGGIGQQGEVSLGTGVIYGVRVRTGQYVDRVEALIYQPSSADNYYRQGDPYFSRGAGGFGGNEALILCPPGQGLIALQGRAGTLVDAIGIVCSDVNHPSPDSPNNYVSPIYGGDGGSPFYVSCVSNYFIDRITVSLGRFVASVLGVCLRAH